MSEPFLVITPDAQYPDDGEVERPVMGSGARLEIYRERDLHRLPAGRVAQADAFLVWHEVAFDRASIAALPRCRVIVRAGVGFDHIDLAAAGEAGIPVCNTPDYGTSEVADHAIALMLTLARGIATYHDALRADPVGSFVPALAPGVTRIRGRRLGIVGLGRIGTATALRAKAFGLEVVAYDPYVSRGQEIAVGVGRVDTLAELLAGSDVVSLHAPLTEETRGMIDAAALAAMPRHAFLINTARGAIVDHLALLEALQSGGIAGAALDVLPQEPADPDHPLIKAYTAKPSPLAGRLVLTPHAAWFSPQSARDARRLSTETLMAYLTRGDLRNCVNGSYLSQLRKFD
ncbi:MAG: C-terminal binding protein [Rhodospirillaceae bacterium]|nr:C-terminal binding protein [Rhodospirillaceae bacterium]